MDNPLILYHADCPDGFGAAWAAYRRYGASGNYKPVVHGTPMPDVRGWDPVFILDFAYPRDAILAAREVANVIVIDHHKTAQAELLGLDSVVFDMELSGAVLAWKYFHPREPVPKLLQYVQDRDLWKNELPHSREICNVIMSKPYDFYAWGLMALALDMQISKVVNRGAAIEDFKTRMVERVLRNSYVDTVGNYLVPVTNCPLFQSECGEALYLAYPEYPFVALYWDRDAKTRVWGLRSDGLFDVSEVAKAHGGGGHAAAAGFQEER